MSKAKARLSVPGAADLARILSIVAHDLRSPTSVISGDVRMLAEHRLNEANRAASLQRLQRAGDRVAVISQQAADLAFWLLPPDGKITPMPVALEALLTRALEGMNPAHRVKMEINPIVTNLSVRSLGHVGLVSAVTTVVETVAREAADGEVRIVAQPAGSARACDVFVGPAAQFTEVAGGHNPEDAATIAPKLGASTLGFVLAVAIVQAHGGRVWMDGGRSGVIGLRLAAL